jgi:hypothetical protein
MNKYTFRRLLAGVVIVPVVAVAWFLGYAVLVGLGAEPTDTPQGVFGSGLMLGVIATLVLAFWEQINALFDKLGL